MSSAQLSGNMIGVSFLATELDGTRQDILAEAVPNHRDSPAQMIFFGGKMRIIRTSAKAIRPLLPSLSLFSRTVAAMIVRILPVVVVLNVSLLLLFYTEQGQDFLAGARDDFWQACRLLLAVYFLSLLSAFCTSYLLYLPPDWDTGRIFKRVSVWDRKSEKKKSKQYDEKSKKDSKVDAGTTVRHCMIALTTLFTGIFLFQYVLLDLFGLSVGVRLLGFLLLVVSAIGVYIAVFRLIPTTPARSFKNTLSLVCVCVFGLLMFAFFPVQTGLLLGSEFTTFILLSLWLLLFCAMVGHLGILGLETWQAILVILFLVSIVGRISDRFRESVPSATPIRCIEHPCQPPRQPLAKLDVAFSGWRSQFAKPRPVLLLVSAAGGGARASYWTSIVLGRLGDKNRDAIRKHLFLASGVSGGALGIALHANLLATENLPCADKHGALEGCARQFGSNDFLAPVVAAFLTAEVISFSGRDVALEQAWEISWKRTVGTSALREPFLSLWHAKNAPLPNLVLNATSTRTGDRILISNIEAASMIEAASIDPPFNLAEKIDLPLSSAINASARFPFVELPGTVKLSGNSDKTRWEVIADGGYYDNFGAATILDVLDKLEQNANGKLAQLVDLIVLQISSDPTRGMAQTLDDAFAGDNFAEIKKCKSRMATQPPASEPESFLRWLLRLLQNNSVNQQLEIIEKWRAPGDPLEPAGTYGTLMKARTQSGKRILIELRKRVRDLNGHYFHFAMDDNVSAPLGWSLSDKARRSLDLLLDSECHSTQMDKIGALLKDQ